MEDWPTWIVDRYIERFLQEDVGVGDLTTQGLGKLAQKQIQADVVAKQEG